MAKSLDDIIRLANAELADLFQKEYREALNKNTTILDLSYKTLLVNVYRKSKTNTEAFDASYDALVKVLDAKAKRKYTSLEHLPDNYFAQEKAEFVYINSSSARDATRFLVAGSYKSIDKFIRTLSRTPELKKTLFGTNTTKTQKKDAKGRLLDEYTSSVRRKVDLGHIPTEGIDQLVSPLEQKLQDVAQFGVRTGNSRVADSAQVALRELYSLQADAQYEFKNVAADEISLAKNKLGEGYVVITLHRQRLNQAFSKKETQILANLRNKIVSIITSKDFINVSGSNTIKQDLIAQIKHALDPKQNKAPKSHPKQKRNKPNFTKVLANVKTTSASVQVKKQSSTAIGADQGSLANLQMILDSRLAEKVAENMGQGNRTDVLNYRTGRFSDSVKVERLSLSRAGMITAFYTYMRNPYGTFSAGGRQQYPRSRDPKTLISKSIREIAAEQAYTKLRAVNV